MDTYITDKTYKEISELAYLDLKEGDYPDTLDSANWKVIEPEGAKLHRRSGFDAVVLKNDITDQIVIGYRGTEPEGKFKDKFADWKTDAFDVVGGRTRKLEDAITDPERHNIFKNSPFKLMKDNMDWENNQFHQAEELYETVQLAYPNSDISLTGHSLGGGLAQYVAARHDVSGMTYSAPSVMNLLDDVSLAKVNEGQFDNKMVNVVHPNDSVGAGGISEYERHVGLTVYKGQDFDTANAMYQNWKFHLQLKVPFQPLGAGSPMLVHDVGIDLDLDKLQIGNIFRLIDSFSKDEGKGYHSMKQYEFDENGNLIGPLIDRSTGETLDISPRWAAHQEALSALSNLMSGVVAPFVSAAIGSVGGKGDAKIQLTPEELAQSAREMRLSLSGFSNDAQASIQMFQTHISTSESQSFTPIAYNATATLQRINRWYQESISEIADYIERKREDFVIADQQ
ncbi:lipase family protein [Paenibacillus xylanilyticus]|uniref:lipase family protein n=1 Tax=Paenibacillus xylanilyticus TaxID=248903 RepID=UPI003AAA7F6D